MAGKNYTWQVSSPNIGTGEGFISSAYKVNGKIPITTISTSNPLGYVKVFPNSNSTNFNIKNLEYAIRTDGKITYRVQDGTQNPRLYNSLQELADGRGNWDGTTTMQVQKQMTANLTESVKTYNQQNPDKKIGPSTPPLPKPDPATVARGDVDASVNQAKDIDISIPSVGVRNNYGPPLYYPIDLNGNKQDRIVFTMKRSEGSVIRARTGAGQKTIERRETTKIEGAVYLPVQPSITDNNSVDWSGGTLNAIQAFGAAASYQFITSAGTQELGQNVGNILGKVAQLLKGTGNNPSAVQQALRLYFAQEAVGAQNLLSRATGAILNPNLELLFNGPSLRPFAFNFRLSPRDEKEAANVRKIIRFFKQGMSVKSTESNIFLQSPNIFDIKYETFDNAGSPIIHPSLNRIKSCALLSCDVDYTPDGTYMTYNDSSRTMTSYQLSLRFSELEPIYENDYNTGPLSKNATFIKDDEIGY